MAGRYVNVECTACGSSMQVGCTKRKPALCQECRIRRYIENLASLRAKSGEPYERNKAAIQASWARRRQGGAFPS